MKKYVVYSVLCLGLAGVLGGCQTDKSDKSDSSEKTTQQTPKKEVAELKDIAGQKDSSDVFHVVLDAAQKDDFKTIHSFYGKDIKAQYDEAVAMTSEEQTNEILMSQYIVIKDTKVDDFVKKEKDGVVTYTYTKETDNTKVTYTFYLQKENGLWRLVDQGAHIKGTYGVEDMEIEPADGVTVTEIK